MKLHAMGIGYRHDANFRINRETGSGDNLLLIWKTPAKVRILGKELSVPKDSAILYGKDTPQIYGADGGSYCNHWVHFECAKEEPFFARIGAVFDKPVKLASVFPAESVLELLRREGISEDKNREECEDLLLRLLIAKTVGSEAAQTAGPHSEALRRLRAGIYGNPAGSLSVSAMAKELSLSPSYFQSLYKREFGISCYEDVLCARAGLAEYYLRNTQMTVKEVADLCGFENDVHFMRQFKKRTGMTALEFRKRKG